VEATMKKLFLQSKFTITWITICVILSLGFSRINTNQDVLIYLPLISKECFDYLPWPPEPIFSWYTCFNSLNDFQNYHLNNQGRYSLIPDFTGSGKGNILKSEAAPDLAYFDPQYLPNGRTVVRSYPTNYFPQKFGPHMTVLDVYLENDFYPPIQSTSDGPFLSLLTDFSNNGIYGPDWKLNATVDLMKSGGGFTLFWAIPKPEPGILYQGRHISLTRNGIGSNYSCPAKEK
jgi:hypothetical protein